MINNYINFVSTQKIVNLFKLTLQNICYSIVTSIVFVYLIFFRTQGKADYINLNQFIIFLNEKQRDPRLNEILYPLYDEKRAAEIITTYEQDETFRSENKLTKDGLIRYVNYQLSCVIIRDVSL